MRASQEIVDEIQGRLGFVPAHLALAIDVPVILGSLWQQTRTAYLDNPLPALLKERTLAYLSRWCSVPYGISYHVCALAAAGVPADQIAALLDQPDPRAAGVLDQQLEVLETARAPLNDWPAPSALPDSIIEEALRVVAAARLLNRGSSSNDGPVIRRVLGRERYACWVALLGYFTVFHQWVISHPELEHQDDERTRDLLSRLVREQPRLVDLLTAADPQPQAGGQRAGGHLSRIFDGAPVGCIQVDASGRIRFANRQVAEIFGYEREALVGQPVERLVPARFHDVHPTYRAGFLAESSVRMMGAGRRVYGVRKDGSEVPLEVGLSAEGSGARREATAIIVDITARERAEGALHRVSDARERLSALFHHGAHGNNLYAGILDLLLEIFASEHGFVGYIDEHGSLVCPSMTRHIFAQCQGPDRSVVFPRQTWAGLWGRVMREKACLIENEPHSVPDDGRLLIQRSMGAPLLYRGELIGMMKVANRGRDYDEIDRKVMEAIATQVAPLLAALQVEQELKRSNAELESFAYIASHDLQEPLRMVASYTEMLARRYQGQLDERADKYIHYAVDGARRMQQLIQDILAFARIGTREASFERTDFGALLDGALRDLTVAIETSQAEITRDQMPALSVDASQIVQVFSNLIGNALKFRGEAPPRIHISAQRADDVWTFGVSDNGIGIEPGHSLEIFEMFQRLHDRSKYTGSGIGLALARRIVERHGGKIWFESEPGRGTTFYFTLAADSAGRRPRRGGGPAA